MQAIAVLGVLGASALLAFLRGFVLEILGIGAWIGAAVIALWSAPLVRPYAQHYIGQYLTDPAVQDYVGFGGVFVVAVIVLLMISHWVGALVRQSVLGGVDRSLGMVFGLGRGAALVVVAYFAGTQLFKEPHRNGYGEAVFGATGPVLEFAAALEAAQTAG